MATTNPTRIYNRLRVGLKRSVIAVAVVAVLGFGRVQTQAATETFNLGLQDAGTTIQNGIGGFIPWLAKGSLPPGSILRSVSATVRLDSSTADSWTSDLVIYFDGVPQAPGTAALLQIGGDYSGAVGTVGQFVGWNGGDDGPGTTIVDTKTAGIDWIGEVDLNTVELSLGNNYAPSNWSGTVTIEYDAPLQARILSFSPAAAIGTIVGNAAAINWIVPFGTNITTLAPTFTLSSGTCDKNNGGPATYNFTNPVNYTVTDGATVNTYTVTVSVAPNEHTVIWSVAGGGLWNHHAVNWIGQTSGMSTPFFDGVNVDFNKPDGGAITIAPYMAPLSITVSAPSGTYFFGGGPLTTGSLTKTGDGNLTISSVNNTFGGGTVIEAGQLKMDVQANSALGTGPITLNGGRLFLERVTVANALIVNGGDLLPSNGFGDSWNGTVTLNSNLIVTGDGNSGTMTFNGSISGVGGLTFNGPVALRPVLAVANSYTGPTSVTACTLQCNDVDALGSGALSISSTVDSRVNLNYPGEHKVTSLTLGGVPQTLPGTYGSTASGAEHPNDTYFDVNGTGMVRVGGGSGFATWAASNAPGQTPGQDYDKDGVQNGIEYFMGQTGSSFTALPGLDASRTVTWTKDPAYEGTWQVQTSTNLASWTNVAGTDNGTSVSYTLPPGEGRLFVHLLVAPTP